ncbi:peptidoglycan DD-metalloendopeptidase family protein [Hugenholtzia roseola]|uniref:peptidoglycan DD-metalloendopeptidase family protein n=1 Tax=Hugenholtzia roseola TaxID=1002 RepID=UPI000685DB58|nr:peptidoglycan DD-metalloendopeptidase family protein [Hugenholtzia roseola]
MKTHLDTLSDILVRNKKAFQSLLPQNYAQGKAFLLDLSIHNPILVNLLAQKANLAQMEAHIWAQIKAADADFGIGGYNEERSVYQQSAVFDTQEGSRSIHLGIDIWLPAQTPIFAPLSGKVHSFANNAAQGDYGGTIILEHELENTTFYTLYGHLSLASLQNLYEGKPFEKGELLCRLGEPAENGGWVAHLHFQIIADMLGKKGDFIGVAPKSERDYYLALCPNPMLVFDFAR